MSSDPSVPVLDALPPHPALPRYYRGAKRGFLQRIFDAGAADYDRVENLMALGSGAWYRRRALLIAGLKPGMRVLDVAIGTGLVAREQVKIVGDASKVLGIDPSSGMLREARRSLTIPVIMGIAEQLPVSDDCFDFISMGYALRHVSDLHCTFAEFFRVLKPGGTICILELTQPQGRLKQTMLQWYMRTMVPLMTRLVTQRAGSEVLWEYYWETIRTCISPQRIEAALEQAGFQNVRRYMELGVFAQYVGQKPNSNSQ